MQECTYSRVILPKVTIFEENSVMEALDSIDFGSTNPTRTAVSV